MLMLSPILPTNRADLMDNQIVANDHKPIVM